MKKRRIVSLSEKNTTTKNNSNHHNNMKIYVVCENENSLWESHTRLENPNESLSIIHAVNQEVIQ